MNTITPALISLALAATTTANPNPTTFAWGENIGWINFDTDPATGPVFKRNRGFLQGFIWSENTGWINLGNGNGPYGNQSDQDFGVNILADGNLTGFAWGENIGWINFNTADMSRPAEQWARYDEANRRLRGYAWGENVGWINFNDDTAFPGFEPICLGDLDDDGATELDDLLALLAAFGTDDRIADVNGDGQVTLDDLLEVLSGFGTCIEQH